MQVLYLARATRTKETLPDFLKWRQVTRPPLVFRGLTGSQRTPGFGASHCQEHGIIHQTFAPYTPQQNGVAGCKNKLLKEMMNVMLTSSGITSELVGGTRGSFHNIERSIDPLELFHSDTCDLKYV